MKWFREWRIQCLQVELAEHIAKDEAARKVYTSIGECSPVFLINNAGRIAALRERLAQLKKEKP